MKKQLHFLLFAGLFFCFSLVKAQVGIGTPMPDLSAQLDVVAQDKGILIPRIALSDIHDMETITGGNIESLLVFNTTSTNAIKPGYYYWFDNSWHRVVTAQDVSQGGVVENMVVYDPLNDVFNYINNTGDNVTIDLESLVKGKETITRLTENPDGTYSYYNEASIDEAGEPIIGSGLVIDIPGSVVNEFKEIITNNTVKEQLFEAINNSYVGGNVYFDGSKFTYVTQEGDNKEVTIQEIIEANETKTTIFDEGNGTYTYTNESGDEVVIDANTTTVTLTDGVYTFTDASGVVITSIDTNALASGYDNTTSGLTADNVQNAIDEVVTAINSGGGVKLTDNGDGTVSLVSEDGTTLGSVDKTSVVDQGDGTYTIDNGDGTPVTINTNADALAFDNTTNGFTSTNVQDAIDELATDLANTTDILVNNGNGTFTHTAVDGKEVIIDANTTTVELVDGVYTFKDGSGATITTIDTNATASGYENATSGLTADNVQDAIDEVSQTIEANKGTLEVAGGLEFTGGTDGTAKLIADAGIQVADGGISTDKLAADAVTNEKLADNAVQTENILDGTVGTADLADLNITAEKLVADSGSEGMVGVVQADGSVVYQNISATNVDGNDFTSSDLTITNGIGATLTAVTAEITDGAVDTAALADDAVTNVKLADNAVESENIADGAVGTIDLEDESVTAGKMDSELALAGQLPIADGSGGVTYGNVSATNVDGQNFTSSDLTITNGIGATLTAVTAEITDGAVDTAALADDAVTNVKLADNAVESENIADGAVGTSDLDEGSVTAGKMDSELALAGQLPIADGSGGVTYGNVSATNVDGNDFTSSDLTITNGTGATLTAVTAEITDGAVDNNALGGDAVTNDKLADNAVQTENIVDRNVTAGKLTAEISDAGKVGVVQADGSVVYQNLSATSVDGQDFTSNDLTITNGTGATLTAVTAEITDGAVDNDALGADAVTNDKLADNAVQTENILDGTVGTADLADLNITAEKLVADSGSEGMVGVVQVDGSVVYQNVSATNVDGNDLTAGDPSITVVDGIGATLVNANISVSPNGITNAKLADNAVQTENIVDGAVGTIDLEDESVTAEKLVANSGSEGMVGVVQADGSVVYQNISATNVDGNNFTSNDLTITNGVGATLTAVTAEITDGAVDTAALADDAVTNVKLADNAVQTENIVDGGVQASDINSNVAGNGLIQNATDGSLEVDPSAVAVIADGNITSDDLLVTGGDNAAFTDVTLEINADAINATKINDDVAGEGLSRDTNTSALNVNAVNGLNVVNDNVQLGGVLLEPTTITTDIDNTLAIQGLQTGSQTDNIVVADPVSGALKQVNAAMPKFFYMPSIIFDTSVSGSFSRNLHQEYLNQFTGAGNPGLVRSTGAPADIPNLPTATELYYYITYYDTAVFSNVTVDENGLLSYDVIGNATPASFMNIVFVVK